MIVSLTTRHLSRSAPTLRASTTAAGLRCRSLRVRHQHAQAESTHLPRIVQPSLWEQVFPRSLRESAKETFRPFKKGPVNPATYFLWIYILIGSQAIRIIGLQNESRTYMRKAELRIGRLREVVEKLQKGEPVDVEKVLGSGDEEQEQEWEEALREIEAEERSWQDNKRRREQEMDRKEAEKQDANPVSSTAVAANATPDLPGHLTRPTLSTPGFY